MCSQVWEHLMNSAQLLDNCFPYELDVFKKKSLIKRMMMTRITSHSKENRELWWLVLSPGARTFGIISFAFDMASKLLMKVEHFFKKSDWCLITIRQRSIWMMATYVCSLYKNPLIMICKFFSAYVILTIKNCALIKEDTKACLQYDSNFVEKNFNIKK